MLCSLRSPLLILTHFFMSEFTVMLLTCVMRLFSSVLSTSHDALAFVNCWVSSWEPCLSCRNSPLRPCSATFRSAKVLLTALDYRERQVMHVRVCVGILVCVCVCVTPPTSIVGLSGCSSVAALLSVCWVGLIRFSSSNSR